MDIFDTSLQFEDRFVAFLDILGFTEYISSLEKSNNQDDLHKIKSILNFMNEETEESHYQTDLPVYETINGVMYEKELGNPRMLYVSDCMIISADGNMDGFKILSNKIHKIITDLAVDGIFCRGAISKGKLLHKGPFVFGSAYIKSYQLESKEAFYPRVIIDPDIMPYFEEGRTPLGPAFYAKDLDGYHYLKYFTWQFFPPYLSDWVHYLLTVRRHIVEKANYYFKMCENKQGDQLTKAINLFKKYEWLTNEFNRNIDYYSEGLSGILDAENISIKQSEEWAIKRIGEHIPREQFKPRVLNKISQISDTEWH